MAGKALLGDALAGRREALFRAARRVVALDVPKKACSAVAKALRSRVLRVRNTRPVVAHPSDDSRRLVLMNSTVQKCDLSPKGDFSKEEREVIEGVQPPIRVIEHQIELGYEQLTMREALKTLLGNTIPEKDIPKSFETIGHVAHLNLRKELVEHQNIIGQVLLDKNPRIKTVVNKTGSLSNEYRTLDLELIAGLPEYRVEVIEHGSRFRLDVRRVYWNSRLQTEHRHLVSTFDSGDVVLDATCGIGPFAIPAAKKKGCTVYANDKNPQSVLYLKENAELNKVASRIHCFNDDARDFIRAQIAGGVRPHHIVLNLPALSIEFLDALVGAFDPSTWTPQQLPRIHCYCFSKSDTPAQDVLERMGAAMQCPDLSRDRDGVVVREVRDVAPQKLYLHASFRVPPRVAFKNDDGNCPPPAKKAKIDSS